MNVTIDPKTQLPVYALEKKDISDANLIRKMMEHKGWKVLKKYVEVGRENLIDNGKNGVKLKDKSELSKERWAILMGFDECSRLAERVVARAEEFSKEEYKEEQKHESYDDE